MAGLTWLLVQLKSTRFDQKCSLLRLVAALHFEAKTEIRISRFNKINKCSSRLKTSFPWTWTKCNLEPAASGNQVQFKPHARFWLHSTEEANSKQRIPASKNTGRSCTVHRKQRSYTQFCVLSFTVVVLKGDALLFYCIYYLAFIYFLDF